MVKNWFKADCNKFRKINKTINECINNKLKHRSRIINTWNFKEEKGQSMSVVGMNRN